LLPVTPRYPSDAEDSGAISDLRFVLILFGLALVVRLAFYLAAFQTPLFHAPIVDEAWHDQWARELLNGHWQYPHVFFRAPLYPYALAVLYALSGESVALARAFQLLISCVSVVVFYLLARRLAPRRVARVAALVLCFYGTMIWYEQALLLPVVEIFFDLVLLYLLVRYDRSGSRFTLAAAGLVAGLSIITRPNLGLFLLGALWFLSRRTKWAPKVVGRAQRAALFGIAVVLPVVPVALHNYRYSGDFIPVSSQGGINFYLGNNPVADGLTMVMPELPIDETMSWDRFVPATDSVAQKLSGRKLSPGEIQTFWSNRFMRFMFSHPGDFLAGLARKTYFFFAGAENSDNFDLYFYRRLNPVYAALVWRWGLHFPFGLISPLALAGLVMLWPRRSELRWLYAFVLLYAPTVIGVLVTARHRLPVIPMLVLVAVWGVWLLCERWPSWSARRRLAVGAALAGLFVVTNLELFGLGFQNDRQSHLNLALAYQKLSQTGPKVAHLDSALAIDSGSVVALNGRGVAYLADGDLYMAKNMFRLALSLAPQSMEIRNNLALVLMRQGSWESARLLYAEVISLASKMPEPFQNMALLYAAMGKPDSALAYYDSALVRDSLYAQALNNKGSLYASLGDSAQALVYWRRAVGADPGYGTPAILLVGYYRTRGDLDSALAVLEAAQKPFRQATDWYYWRVTLAMNEGDREGAARFASEALRLFPADRNIQSLAARLGLQP
jgi:tetratricopeptide (TPR) repeat protein